MGRTGRVHGWRHDQKKPLDGDGFRSQGRAIGHRGDRRAVCRRERLRGARNAGRRAGRDRADRAEKARQERESGGRSLRKIRQNLNGLLNEQKKGGKNTPSFRSPPRDPRSLLRSSASHVLVFVQTLPGLSGCLGLPTVGLYRQRRNHDRLGGGGRSGQLQRPVW